MKLHYHIFDPYVEHLCSKSDNDLLLSSVCEAFHSFVSTSGGGVPLSLSEQVKEDLK